MVEDYEQVVTERNLVERKSSLAEVSCLIKVVVYKSATYPEHRSSIDDDVVVIVRDNIGGLRMSIV